MTSDGIRLRWLHQTCTACPSQWEGKTIAFQEVYIRYRWGRLTVQVADQPGQDALEAAFLVEEVLGAPLDGFMTTDDLRDHLAGRVIIP